MSSIVKPSGREMIHPIYVGAGPRYDFIRAAMRRIDSLPEHEDDITIKDCVTKRPATRCTCGHYEIEWEC
jgi:hypothetical protein